MTRTIAFIGFMGAGKTEAARAAAAAMGRNAIDADAELERRLGEPIASFFERNGEAAFRELEEQVALELLDEGGVVALGGGAVESDRIRRALGDCLAVWCRVDLETAWERAGTTDRPLAGDRGEFERRYRERLPLYEASASAILPEGGSRVGSEAGPWLGVTSGLADGRIAWARSSAGAYPAIVGTGATGLLAGAGTAPGIFEPLARAHGLHPPGRWFGVVDRAVLEAHESSLPELAGTVRVDASEERKTLGEAERILSELAGAGVRRDDGVAAIGGGVVGDLAGFCAATYQRGVAVAQLPTTLVAQVDSAYGGKTGVDLPVGKNYIGAYHQPLCVLADPSLLTTLPPQEVSAGMAEVVKTALIGGGRLWERVRALDPVARGDFAVGSPRAGTLAEVVFGCAATKLDVVAADERDLGMRAALNLGHTVGHGIEAATGFRRYRHGEAVALGLLAALRLSDAGELRREVTAVLAREGLPTQLGRDVAVDDVLAAVARDKKRTAGGVAFVLLERPGEPLVGQRVDVASLRAAVEELR